jgi:hypothetical protein
MMTRAATVNPVSMRNLASITLSIIALSTATLGISRYGDGSRPVADFLSRAQSEAEARSFEELLGTLGEKPAATQKATPVAHADEPQVAAKPVTASTQSSTPAPQGIASPPKPAVKPRSRSFKRHQLLRSPTSAKCKPLRGDRQMNGCARARAYCDRSESGFK